MVAHQDLISFSFGVDIGLLGTTADSAILDVDLGALGVVRLVLHDKSLLRFIVSVINTTFMSQYIGVVFALIDTALRSCIWQVRFLLILLVHRSQHGPLLSLLPLDSSLSAPRADATVAADAESDEKQEAAHD